MVTAGHRFSSSFRSSRQRRPHTDDSNVPTTTYKHTPAPRSPFLLAGAATGSREHSQDIWAAAVGTLAPPGLLTPAAQACLVDSDDSMDEALHQPTAPPHGSEVHHETLQGQQATHAAQAGLVGCDVSMAEALHCPQALPNCNEVNLESLQGQQAPVAAGLSTLAMGPDQTKAARQSNVGVQSGGARSLLARPAVTLAGDVTAARPQRPESGSVSVGVMSDGAGAATGAARVVHAPAKQVAPTLLQRRMMKYLRPSMAGVASGSDAGSIQCRGCIQTCMHHGLFCPALRLHRPLSCTMSPSISGARGLTGRGTAGSCSNDVHVCSCSNAVHVCSCSNDVHTCAIVCRCALDPALSKG